MGRCHTTEVDIAALRLRHHLLRHHQDITIRQLLVGALDPLEDESREIVSRLDQGQARKGDEFQASSFGAGHFAPQLVVGVFGIPVMRRPAPSIL